MVEVPDFGADFIRMWQELLHLARRPPAPWTLIGAHMVALHAWKAGLSQPRASRDADILVNARVVSGGTQKVSETLVARGFVLDGVSPEGVGHPFVSGAVRLDVLGPDGLGVRVKLLTVSGARTVAVPGGSQALRRTVMIEVKAGKVSGPLPVPDLLGAILVKTRAIAVDDQPDAQRRDVAFLLSLVGDPDPLVARISVAERGWLKRHQEFCDPASRCFDGLRMSTDSATVFRRLAGVR